MQGKPSIRDIYELVTTQRVASPVVREFCHLHQQAMHLFMVDADYRGALQRFSELYRRYPEDLPIFRMKERLEGICDHGKVWPGYFELK